MMSLRTYVVELVMRILCRKTHAWINHGTGNCEIDDNKKRHISLSNKTFGGQSL